LIAPFLYVLLFIESQNIQIFIFLYTIYSLFSFIILRHVNPSNLRLTTAIASFFPFAFDSKLFKFYPEIFVVLNRLCINMHFFFIFHIMALSLSLPFPTRLSFLGKILRIIKIEELELMFILFNMLFFIFLLWLYSYIDVTTLFISIYVACFYLVVILLINKWQQFKEDFYILTPVLLLSTGCIILSIGIFGIVIPFYIIIITLAIMVSIFIGIPLGHQIITFLFNSDKKKIFESTVELVIIGFFIILFMLTLYFIIFPIAYIIGSIFALFYFYLLMNFIELGKIISAIIYIIIISFLLLIIIILIIQYFYNLRKLLVPNNSLLHRYSHLHRQNIEDVVQIFYDETLHKHRLFILQYIRTSNSSLPKKKKAVIKMINEEEKSENRSEEIIDTLFKIYQELKREQRQTKLMVNTFSISQIKSFDFIDLKIENNYSAVLSPIDSAHQQLLNWLKGETPAKPSIDKLLIHQWQDYEIGIGLKYSGQMGGDFYDLFQLTPDANNQIGIIVGDLAGHGVETALNLSKTHNFWVETDLNQDVLTTMRAFEQNFKTTFQLFPNREGCELCYLQIKNQEITLSRAGLHLGLIKDNQWQTLATTQDENFGSIGKWSSNPVKRYTHVELKAGETLIVYTDGLFENANQNGEQFGQDNFKQLLLQQQNLDMNTLIDTVFRTVYEYCQPEAIEDDETLLVIRRKA